jgi:hypothetical protein
VKQVPRWSARQTTVAPQLYTDHDKKSLGRYRLQDAFWPFGANAADQRSVRWLNGRFSIAASVKARPDYLMLTLLRLG